jgi:hypothetical protein
MPVTEAPTIVSIATSALATLASSKDASAGAAGSHLFLYADRGRSPSDKWRRLKFADGLATQFRQDVMSRLLGTLTERELVPFSFDSMVAGHIGVIAKAELPEIANWFEAVPTPDWPHIFDGKEAFFSKVRFHVTTMAIEGVSQTIKIYKQRTRSSLLHQGGFKAIFNKSSHQFSAAQGDVFDFSVDCDFFEWMGLIFILNLHAFEAITNIRQITLTKAHDALAAIASIEGLEVIGLGQVATKLKDKPGMAKKLAAALRQGTIAAIDAKALLERITEKKLPLQTGTTDGKKILHVDPSQPEQMVEFVNIITDTYLMSPPTKKEYKVHSKDPV